jgi:DNA-binding MarR family transcriptional regulator/predicted GNAT family N-acyltransferase
MTPTARIRTELRHLVRELGLLNRNCLNSGMTLSQAHILAYINRNGPTPFAELQLQLGLDKASLSRTVNVLRKREYLRIVGNHGDKRTKNVQILAPGNSALSRAEKSANSAVDSLLAGCDENSWIKIYDALRLLRLSALRNNLATNPKRVRIEHLRDAYFDSAMELLIQTFSNEQNIPGQLVPLSKSKSPRWWCVRVGEEVLGAVAAWKESGQWHWGRFAVDKNFRGLGIGKTMAIESITELFTGAADKIIIEARDITVGIIQKLGGKQTRPPFDFYGEPVTPMVLEKEAFLQRVRN